MVTDPSSVLPLPPIRPYANNRRAYRERYRKALNCARIGTARITV